MLISDDENAELPAPKAYKIILCAFVLFLIFAFIHEAKKHEDARFQACTQNALDTAGDADEYKAMLDDCKNQ